MYNAIEHFQDLFEIFVELIANARFVCFVLLDSQDSSLCAVGFTRFA